MMITGDHPVTATAIAGRLGLSTDQPALTGTEMADQDDRMLAARPEQISVAARVSPGDKLRIVHALQSVGKDIALAFEPEGDELSRPLRPRSSAPGAENKSLFQLRLPANNPILYTSLAALALHWPS